MEKNKKIILGVFIALIVVFTGNFIYQSTIDYQIAKETEEYAGYKIIKSPYGEKLTSIQEKEVLNEIKKYNPHVMKITLIGETNNHVKYSASDKDVMNTYSIIFKKKTGVVYIDIPFDKIKEKIIKTKSFDGVNTKKLGLYDAIDLKAKGINISDYANYDGNLNSLSNYFQAAGY